MFGSLLRVVEFGWCCGVGFSLVLFDIMFCLSLLGLVLNTFDLSALFVLY